MTASTISLVRSSSPRALMAIGVSVIFNYTGAGFQEGSGDLSRGALKLNQHYVKDYGNVQTQIGSLITPYNVNSGQNSLAGESTCSVLCKCLGRLGRKPERRQWIIAALFGWYYPR